MSKIKIVFLFLALFDFAHGQSTKYFRKVIGMPSPYIENGLSVKPFNGGYIIGDDRFALQSQPQDGDALIVRTNAFGNKIWEQVYSDSINNIALLNLTIFNDNFFLQAGKAIVSQENMILIFSKQIL